VRDRGPLVSRPIANFLWIFAATTAALNFLNLLPFWPLDGGRCLRAIVHAFEPRAALGAALAMSAAFAAAAVRWDRSSCCSSRSSARRRCGRAARLPGMTPGQAALALGAYVFTAAAHFAGGALILSVYL
jgi:Zn-dependent protease